MRSKLRIANFPTDLLCKSKTWGQAELRNSNEVGFTLLELIVSMTILSLIAVIIGSAFRLGMNAWEKGENEAESVQVMRVLSGLVFQQLKSAYPYKTNIDDEDVVVFRGEEESMLFVTSLSAPYPGGFKWVRYLYKDGALMYKEGMLPDKELIDNISGDEEILETDVEEVIFQYYSNEEEEWQDSWEFSDRLPGAVKVQISYFQPIFVSIPMSREVEDEEGSGSGFGSGDKIDESVIQEI